MLYLVYFEISTWDQYANVWTNFSFVPLKKTTISTLNSCLQATKSYQGVVIQEWGVYSLLFLALQMWSLFFNTEEAISP